MDLVDWQQRFERWILTHHAQDDAAHDLSHFRRVWATATQLAAGGGRPAGTPHGLLFS
jgi:uncharacterized protein